MATAPAPSPSPPQPTRGEIWLINFDPPVGAEMGKTENRHIRHRAFAIVDRTNLEMFRGSLQAVATPASVGGYTTDGLDKLAGPVDQVLREQVQRLRQFIETGSPDKASH